MYPRPASTRSLCFGHPYELVGHSADHCVYRAQIHTAQDLKKALATVTYFLTAPAMPQLWILAVFLVGLLARSCPRIITHPTSLTRQQVLVLIANAIYNIWFHPLRHYPGPRYAAVSRLWYSSKVFGGHHKYAIKRLHDEYGMVVRIAPNELSYIDPRAWGDIYGELRIKYKGTLLNIIG